MIQEVEIIQKHIIIMVYYSYTWITEMKRKLKIFQSIYIPIFGTDQRVKFSLQAQTVLQLFHVW